MAITKVTSGLISADASSIDLNIDAGTLYLDVSENKVGIGTTSPAQKLDIDSGYLNFSNNYGIRWGGATSVALYGHQTSNFLGFQTNSSERMRIDSSGNVGIGTTSPASSLHIDTTGASALRIERNSGTDANCSIEFNCATTDYYVGTNPSNNFAIGTSVDQTNSNFQITSSGNVGIGTSSPAEALTVNGDIGIGGSGKLFNGTGSNSAGIYFPNSTVRIDGYNGITFHSSATTVGSQTERMRIDSSGNLLVGTTSQTFGEKLKVTTSGSGNNAAFFEFTSSDDRAVIISKHGWSTGTTSRTHLAILNDSNTQVGSIAATGTATTFNTSSDARLKDVTGEARGLEVINKLNPVAYNWKESGQADEGLIAQEVLDIVPNAVTGSEEKYYQMDYSKLVVHLVKGMKEQQTIIDDLKTRIETLENA